jgi:general secretion pathway protein E
MMEDKLNSSTAQTAAVTKARRLIPEAAAIGLIPEAMARRYQAVPLQVKGDVIRVGMVKPSDVDALEALAAHCRRRIQPVAASAAQVQEAIDFSFQGYDEIEQQISQLTPADSDATVTLSTDTATEAPASHALRLIIEEAVKARASDIHLQPQEDRLQIRYRIDGVLRPALSLPRHSDAPLISRIKILANMNIADHHRPQDGRFSVETKGRRIDIRVGTAPTVYGEMAVLRLLDKSRVVLDMGELGFRHAAMEQYKAMLSASYGIILVSGPTGAGKTTTLYASLNSMNHVEKNIITVEDPVEYRFHDINQVQVNARAGITFASGLRSMLRLDPDVILVGEIRDAETAQIAVQAALTGHLVLSSIHANDAVSVVFRLLDLGVEPFLVSTALLGVVSQRMVRQVCQECGEPQLAPPTEQLIYQQEMGESRQQFSYGRGCPACAGSGYWGRRGLFEILPVSDAMRGLILSGADILKLREQALTDGMVPLLKDGMMKVQEGLTTPTEVLRTAYGAD